MSAFARPRLSVALVPKRPALRGRAAVSGVEASRAGASAATGAAAARGKPGPEHRGWGEGASPEARQRIVSWLLPVWLVVVVVVVVMF